jgi:DnaD/phage-associated family protein
MLRDSSRQEVTVLSNIFIDRYMPSANGEFVKVYIYLLRILGSSLSSFNLEEMADRLFCTEKDILRALKYWEKENLISINYEVDKTISGISMNSPADDLPKDSQQTPAPSVPVKSALTPDRVRELRQNEDVVQLLYIAEQYLGKTLSASEMQTLLYFYDELHMSCDLIDFLIEHCVGRGHKSIRYIEKVALAWAQEGITTVEMAKQSSSRYSKDYFTILKAMGISNRNPVDNEVAFMNTWIHDYGFTMDLILEACNRTVLTTGQPSFQYADKILHGWKQKNVKHMDDIRLLDAEHKKKKLEKASRKNTVSTSNSSNTPKTPNRFNNFQQREYDFDEYEKRLLNQ